jgi:hypothetical protein
MISSLVTFYVQKASGAVWKIESLPLNLRVANSLVSYIKYIGKMFFPSRLAVFYPHSGRSLLSWQPVVCFIVLVVVSAIVIYMARRRRYLAVGWLWFLGTLVPVIGLVQVGFQAMADRYTYLPSIGIFIMIVWGAAELSTKWSLRRLGRCRAFHQMVTSKNLGGDIRRNSAWCIVVMYFSASNVLAKQSYPFRARH